ncbi:hypothetical protein ABH994_001765 [Bradyrhizobium yuanmingense]
MKILRIVALLAAGLTLPQAAFAGQAEYAEMVAAHARANGVPEALVHRVIMRESRYQPHVVGRGGTIGLMQIKLATARGVGYTGDAAGLRDPNTNLTYAVKYLAGAYRAANGRSRASRALFRGRLLLRCKAPAAGGGPGRPCWRDHGPGHYGPTLARAERQSAADVRRADAQEAHPARPQRAGAGSRPLISVMAGLDPAIHVFASAPRTWMPGPSPRRSGFGRAGGTSPDMTTVTALTTPSCWHTLPPFRGVLRGGAEIPLNGQYRPGPR